MVRGGAAAALVAALILAASPSLAATPPAQDDVASVAPADEPRERPRAAVSFQDSSQGLDSVKWEGGRSEVEFADWNADGNLDILSIGDHGSPNINTGEHGLMTYAGDGTGKWSLTQNGDFGYGGLGVGDLNNDGILDVAVGMHHNYTGNACGAKILEVCLGPNLMPWSTGLATAGEDWGMFGTDLGDFDNDGWLDVGSNSFGCCAGVHMYRNNHDGNWTHTGIRTGGNSRDDFQFGDIDADGWLDAVDSNEIGSVWINDQKGKWTNKDAGLPQGSTGLWGPSLGDVDNDGDLDLSFVVETSGGAWAAYWPHLFLYEPSGWKNASSGIWAQINSTNATEKYWQFTQLGDVDLDGNVDLIGAGQSGFSLFRGDGAAGFTRVYNWTPPKSLSRWEAFRLGADADKNGYPDIAAVIDYGVNEPHFFANQGVGVSVSLISPRGGEKFAPGAVRFIDWTAAGTGTVKLEISTAGNSGPWTLVKDNLANTGRHQWMIPNTPSKNCYIRVSPASGSATNARPFEILGSTGPPPLVAAIDSPDGGENLTAGTIFDVKFTISGGTAPISGKLDLSTSGPSGPWTKMADLTGLTAGSNIHKWSVPATPTVDAFLRAELTDTSPFPQTASDASNAAFTIFIPRVLDHVDLAPANAALGIGDTATFSAKAFDTDGKEMTGATFAWAVSGPFLTVSPSGATATVNGTSIGSGTVDVTAESGGVRKSASAQVTVSDTSPVLTKVVIDPASVSGNVDQRFTLKAKALDAKGGELAGAVFSWTVTGGVGSLDRADGDTVILTLTAAGSGNVELKASLVGKDATARAPVSSKKPFAVPWDLLLIVVSVVVALAIVAGVLSRRRKKKREEQRARHSWPSGEGAGASDAGWDHSTRW